MADGSPQETLALARTAAGAVRSLNHAALGGGLGCPADAYELIGELSLATALAAGRLGCGDGTSPAVAVSGARLFLSDARASAAALARDLGQAQQRLAAVNGSPALEEGERS